MDKNYDFANSSSYVRVPSILPAAENKAVAEGETAKKTLESASTVFSSAARLANKGIQPPQILSVSVAELNKDSKASLHGDIPQEILRVFFDHMRFRLKTMGLRGHVDLNLLASLTGVNTLFNAKMHIMWRALLQSQTQNIQILDAIRNLSDKQVKNICEELLQSDISLKDISEDGTLLSNLKNAIFKKKIPHTLKFLFDADILNPSKMLTLIVGNMPCAPNLDETAYDMVKDLIGAGADVNTFITLLYTPTQIPLFLMASYDCSLLDLLLNARDSKGRLCVKEEALFWSIKYLKDLPSNTLPHYQSVLPMLIGTRNKVIQEANLYTSGSM